jgi:hypothetical protein
MAECMRTHFYFDGIALAMDGRELVLDYSDPDQGGTRLFFRYFVSRSTLPRRVTGYGPEIQGAGKEIKYEELPQDVVCDACDWLRSNIEAARSGNKEQLFGILSDYLRLLEMGEKAMRSPDVPK